MSLCPRCKHVFRTLPDEVGDHPCPRCGLSPWDVLCNGREEEPTDTQCRLCGETASVLVRCVECGLAACQECSEWFHAPDDRANGDWFCEECVAAAQSGRR